jgi:hypothetical protein
VYRTAWKIGRDSSYRVVVVSRGERLVRRISRRIKRVLRDAKFVELFGDVAPLAGTTKDTEAEWERRESTADEPTFVGLGAGGPVPGTRADEVIVDDPIKLQDVQTRASRDKLHEWLLTELLPVANDPESRVLLLGTRYHEDDLYGRLMVAVDDDATDLDDELFDDGELWAVNVRKAVEDGHPLWPELWTLQRLARRRARLGEAVYALQYDNDPTGMGGHVLRAEWRKHVAKPPPLSQIRAGVDLAISERESADETACVVVGETADHQLVVLDAWSARLTHGHRDWLLGVESDGTKLKQTREGQLVDLPFDPGAPQLLRSSSPYRSTLTALNIEAVQWQTQFARELLAATRLPVRAVSTKGVDKVSRARPLAVRYEQGKVTHVERLRGSKLESQQAAFPSAEHDDLVDAEVYAADVGYAPQVFA